MRGLAGRVIEFCRSSPCQTRGRGRPRPAHRVHGTGPTRGWCAVASRRMAPRGSSRTVFREGLVSWARGHSPHQPRWTTTGAAAVVPRPPNLFNPAPASGIDLLPDRRRADQDRGPTTRRRTQHVWVVHDDPVIRSSAVCLAAAGVNQDCGRARWHRNRPGSPATIQQRDRRAAQAADHGLLFALREDLGSALCYFDRLSNSVIMRMDTT